MADTGSPREPLDNLISLVAGPIAAVIRSFDQLRRGADELMKALENFNRTMQNLNDTAERVNLLLNEFEQPTRAIMPQIARTVSLAEDLATRMSAPIDQVVPGLTRLADTLASPVFASLPTDLSAFLDAINDLVRRMSPLGQLAESATGLFGLRIPGVARSMVPGMSPGGTRRAEPEPFVEPEPAPVPPAPAVEHPTPAKRTTPAKRKPPPPKAAVKRKPPAKTAAAKRKPPSNPR